ADFELIGQLQHAAQESIHPTLGQIPRNSQRKKRGQRLPSHGSDVAKPASQAAMPHALWRVPGPLEMDVLEAEIGCDQSFRAAGKRDGCTVVADADSATEAGAAWFRGLAANAADQHFLRQGHGGINHTAANGGASVPRSCGSVSSTPGGRTVRRTRTRVTL